VTVGGLEEHVLMWTWYTGGSLGWKTRGSLLGDFEKVAYELETSTPANPKYAEVKTKEGYHIIMVEGRK
jgi:peptidyl-prolyl cis-trans isomerase NIMA-interacting 4